MTLLIVEDEPIIARRLEAMVRGILGDSLDSLHRAPTLNDAISRVDETPFDVVFLDLNLNGEDGFELLQEAASRSFHCIVASANTDRALRAFELGVLDFVPKPFKRERLAQALARASGSQFDDSTGSARSLAVRKTGRIELIPLADISHIEGDGAYSRLVLINGRSELHDKSLDRLLAILPKGYTRIHKSYIVDVSRVKAWHASEGSRYEAELRGGTRLPVGRERWKELKANW